jgi:hypothetical protein
MNNAAGFSEKGRFRESACVDPFSAGTYRCALYGGIIRSLDRDVWH